MPSRCSSGGEGSDLRFLVGAGRADAVCPHHQIEPAARPVRERYLGSLRRPHPPRRWSSCSEPALAPRRDRQANTLCGASPWCAWAATSRPRTTSPAAPPRARPRSRSCPASSATSPAPPLRQPNDARLSRSCPSRAEGHDRFTRSTEANVSPDTHNIPSITALIAAMRETGQGGRGGGRPAAEQDRGEFVTMQVR